MMNHKAVEYDYEAANYDTSRFNDNMGQHLDHMHKRILASFIDPSSHLLLEAGVGTGRFATWLAKRGLEVVGVDISKEMLKKAKEKREISNVDVGLILADVHFLPFKKGAFDSCICINVIDHFPDINRFLRQVKHVVRSEGYFVFNFSNLQSLYLPIALIINSRKRAMFRSGKIQSSWLTLRDIDDMLLRNGFAVKEVKGCFIASPIPWGNFMIKLIQVINSSAENSRLRFFAGSQFVKVKLVGSLGH
jgi:ubiquinone/menaquinone biosynthesis C-methylase UbiE